MVPSQVWPGFFYQLHVGGMGIPSPPRSRPWQRRFARKPVGTGPFRFSDWASGDRIVLTHNPSHYRPEMPCLDRLEFKVIPASTALTTSLRTVQLDVGRDIPTSCCRCWRRAAPGCPASRTLFFRDWLALTPPAAGPAPCGAPGDLTVTR